MILSKIKEYLILIIILLICFSITLVIHLNIHSFNNIFFEYNWLGKTVIILGFIGTYFNVLKTGKGFFIGILFSLLMGSYIGIITTDIGCKCATADAFIRMSEKYELQKGLNKNDFQ